MTRTPIAAHEGTERTFAGAVLPRTGSASQLLAQYSTRLGSTLLRHRAEIAERASRVEAEIASRIKSEFIANISHELRTPLNSIIGFSKILNDSGTAPLQQEQISEYSGFIFDSANGLLNIVNDIISISKIQSGKYELQIERIDPEELVSACANWTRAQLEGKNKQFVESMDADLPPVDADATQLKNVLIRLLQNAITFTPEGGRIALAAKQGPQGNLMICVSDTGIGMSAEEIEVALTHFGQNDQRLDREHGGTGLGLPISRAIVELLGGRLLLHSEPGAGTDAVVLLPAAGTSLRDAA